MIRKSFTALLTAALVVPTAAPAADPANREAALFGAREGVRQISLSPDGKRIAVIVPAANGVGSALLVGGTEGELKPVMASSGDPDRLSYCRWSTATRLVCGLFVMSGQGSGSLTYTRLLSLNADGSDLKILSARGNERSLGFAQNGGRVIDWLGDGDKAGGTVLMTRVFVPEESAGTRVAQSRQGLGLERIDTTSLRRTTVEAPVANAVEYITDGHGTVRVRGRMPPRTDGYTGNRIEYEYREAAGGTWKPLGTLQLDPVGGATGFNPYSVDRNLNVVYGFEGQGGRTALWRVALDGSAKREMVFAHPSVDVDDLIQIGRQRRVVGVGYATDHRRTVFFDPELKRLSASLSKALPGLPLVSFVDASADEKRLLLWAGSDVDPGRYYLYDKTTRELNELLAVRPGLRSAKLATVKPVSFPAADGTAIPGYLTLPAGSDGRGLPAIVMPHGGPGARDEWGFDWLSQYFAARGYAVLQPNFRGSTGYGAAWFQKNGFQSWRTAVGDVNDGGKWLVAQGIADPAKLGIVGWSYGGYAALQSAVLDPKLFKAIVAVAPVTDLETLRGESRNYANYARVDQFIGRGAHVRDGSPAQNAAAIKAPVLLFHGDRDLNVGVGESRLMTSRLKSAGGRVDYVEFPGLDHQLDDAAARTRMLTKADEFLRASLKL